MTAALDNRMLGSLSQVDDENTAIDNPDVTESESMHPCQVCGAASKVCTPALLQQAVFALLGVSRPAADGALCGRCSNLAAQACHLHTQLQRLDEELRRCHIIALYSQLKDGGKYIIAFPFIDN